MLPAMEKILISACLAGDRTRYDGKKIELTNDFLRNLNQKGQLVKVCPEVLGGMKIPRDPAQIVNGNGQDVLNGKAKVIDCKGRDVTVFFVKGAEYALSIAKKYNIGIAILKDKSPSCGVHGIYDGNFTATIIPGFGVTTAILKQNNIKVFSEKQLNDINIY